MAGNKTSQPPRVIVLFVFCFDLQCFPWSLHTAASRRAEFRQGVEHGGREKRAPRLPRATKSGLYQSSPRMDIPKRQRGTSTGSTLVKVSGHCPCNMVRHSMRREHCPLGKGSKGHGPPLAALAGREATLAAGEQKWKQSQRCNPTEPQGFKSLVWGIIQGWAYGPAAWVGAYRSLTRRCSSIRLSTGTARKCAKMHGRVCSGRAGDTSFLSRAHSRRGL